MPDPFVLPYRGVPSVDWRVWRELHGDVSPRAHHGTARMLEALIRQERFFPSALNKAKKP